MAPCVLTCAIVVFLGIIKVVILSSNVYDSLQITTEMLNSTKSTHTEKPSHSGAHFLVPVAL
jgi:hypothetical protein